MMIGAVDQTHIDRRSTESLGGCQVSKASADDDYSW
jgi:hypothetical protein